MTEKCVSSELERLSPLSPNCCIYRVPERLRQNNEKAYTPQVVSIGPLHHGGEKFQFMEEHKKRYLKDFLKRTKMSFDQLFQLIKGKEGKLRGCYSEAIPLRTDPFVQMIMVDATFIIEVLLRYNFEQLKEPNDYIFNKPFFIEDIWYDMWLIENQLPFFILEDVFKLVDIKIPSNSTDISNKEDINILALTRKYFQSLEAVKVYGIKSPSDTEVNVEHFTDFLRICHLPSNLMRTPPGADEIEDQTAPTITELHQAGVKFRVLRDESSLFDIRFSKGVLEIPKLKLQLETESLFRNMIAYEQRHYKENHINDYVFLIHHLVNTPKDVELLVQNKIIENWLPDKEGASTLLNNLSRGTTLLPGTFYFSSLCKDLHRYCRSPCHELMANLKQNYFNTPWAVIGVFGAVLLILLTVIQTVCSVLQTLQSQSKNH